MELDRGIQLRILEHLKTIYPERERRLIEKVAASPDETEQVLANAVYLASHRLIEGGPTISSSMSGDSFFEKPSQITVHGLDFLADDGGLSAILRVVTVKLHADTIKELIEARIDASTASPEEKSALKKHLSTLSAEAMKTVAKSLVEAGLKHVPDVVPWLHTLLHHS